MYRRILLMIYRLVYHSCQYNAASVKELSFHNVSEFDIHWIDCVECFKPRFDQRSNRKCQVVTMQT